MKIVQRLELFAGFATFIAALLSFYFVHLPNVQSYDGEDALTGGFILRPFLFYFLPSFLTLIGAYIHVAKNSIFGLITILVFAGVVTFLHAVGFLVGSSLNGHPLLGMSPGFFAALTILLALCSTIISATQAEKAKLR